MPLAHYIRQFTARKVMLFHNDIVPFCANARENNPRRGIAGQEFSICVQEGNTVRVRHCNSYFVDEVKGIRHQHFWTGGFLSQLLLSCSLVSDK
jgi:hypothetical protein